MSAKFRTTIDTLGGTTVVKISGALDDDAALPIWPVRQGERIVVDLGEVGRINSFGVRNWIAWVSALAAQGARLALVRCSPAIVAQINNIDAFLGGGQVESFYLPYYCPACDAETTMLLDVSAAVMQLAEAPLRKCEACGGPMEFDDVEDRYFSFLRR